MATKIFVSLPATDLKKSMDFFKRLGFSFSSQFINDTTAFMVISEDVYTMLLTQEKSKELTTKAEAAKTTEAFIWLATESRDKVNDMLNDAVKAGGSEVIQPMDFAFMHGKGFSDATLKEFDSVQLN